MASTSQKWLIGCSLGCVAILLVLFGLGVVGTVMVRKAIEGVQAIEDASGLLAQRYGRPGDFQPAADGTIPAERIEAFLEVRDRMAETRAELERSMERLSGRAADGPDSTLDVLKMIGSGVGLLPKIFSFYGDRNRALLEAGMGPGEYIYIYSMVYHSWLGKPLADGPPFNLVTDDDDANVRIGDADEEEVEERRRRETLDHLQPLLREMLSNQLAAVDEQQILWREQLEREIATLEGNPERLPWEDSPPPQLEASLRPYRERLQASYSVLCNPLEVGLHGR